MSANESIEGLCRALRESQKERDDLRARGADEGGRMTLLGLEKIRNHIENIPAVGAMYAPELISEIDNLLKEVARLRRERDVARAEVEMLRGVGCCEGGDGPCGACLKCARRERDDARAELGETLDELAFMREGYGDADPAELTTDALWLKNKAITLDYNKVKAEVEQLQEVIADLRGVVKDMRVLRATVEGADGFRVHLIESEWDLLAASLAVKP